MERRPFGLRFSGYYLMAIGLYMAGTGAMNRWTPVNRAVLAWIGVGVLAVLGGIGLLRYSWWGWIVGLIWGLAALGYVAITIPLITGDFIDAGARAALLIFLVWPALLLLIVLLRPGTIRWFRLRRSPFPRPVSPPAPPA